MENFYWNGFQKPEYPAVPYIKLTQEFFDILPHVKGEATLKILLYVYRHTFGYNDYNPGDYVHLTTEEFMKGRERRNGTKMDNGTGLSDRGVKDGIKSAENQGLLEVKVDKTDRARIKKSYRLRLANGPSNQINQKPVPGWVKFGFSSYDEYINSPGWKEKSRLAKQAVGNRCQVCNSTKSLEAHHRTYENVCEEKEGDITVLCRSCHSNYEKIKKGAKLVL